MNDNSSDDREPTADEAAGIAWWNALTEAERQHWMRQAGDTGRVVDAWGAYKTGAVVREGERIVRRAIERAARRGDDVEATERVVRLAIDRAAVTEAQAADPLLRTARRSVRSALIRLRRDD